MVHHRSTHVSDTNTLTTRAIALAETRLKQAAQGFWNAQTHEDKRTMASLMQRYINAMRRMKVRAQR